MDTKLKSVIKEAIYDTFSGYFHPDDWEGLTEKAIAQIEATEQVNAAECSSITRYEEMRQRADAQRERVEKKLGIR